MPKTQLLCFAAYAHQNDRDGAWYRIATVRRDASGSLWPLVSDVSPALARRLMDSLCDRYGIDDRSAMMAGRPFYV